MGFPRITLGAFDEAAEVGHIWAAIFIFETGCSGENPSGFINGFDSMDWITAKGRIIQWT